MLSLVKFVVGDSNWSWYTPLCTRVCVCECAFPNGGNTKNSAQTPFWVTSDSCHTLKMEGEKKKEKNRSHSTVRYSSQTHTHTQFHIYQQPHEMSYSDETLRRLKMLNSHLIKRVYAFAPSRKGKARFDKSDMWVDRERWELNLSLQEKIQLFSQIE